MLTFTVVVPAAGVGSRMGASCPKQYLPLAGKFLIEHTLERLLAHPRIERVVVPIASDDDFFPTLPVASHPRLLTTMGGRERADSVLNGLNWWRASGCWCMMRRAPASPIRISIG